MAAKKTPQVVRVVLFHNDPDRDRFDKTTTLVECLRYAGIVSIVRDNDTVMAFDIYPPNGVQDKPWAKMNAERMRSFGYNAQDVPARSPFPI